jgi:hypothetical protein
MPPEGYTLNHGQVTNFHIPVGDGLYQEAKWICLNDDGTIFGYSSTQGPNEQLYIINLYAEADTSTNSFRPWWPRPTTGGWPAKSHNIGRLTMTSLPWWSSSRGTNVASMQHEPASCLVSPTLCLPVPLNASSHSIMWPGSPALYAQVGRGLAMEYGAPMYEGIHCGGGVMTLALGQH